MESLVEALRIIASKCPRIVRQCYWSGTSAISLEELNHRKSYDLDFHTRTALQDVRPLLAELRQAFPRGCEIVSLPSESDLGFRAILSVPSGEQVVIEVFSNFEDVLQDELIPSSSAQGIDRVTLRKYARDKAQCLAERNEARDLVDLHGIISRRPEMRDFVKQKVLDQDHVILAERMLGWSDERLLEDLKPYTNSDRKRAAEIRDLVLSWIKAGGGK